ncbi:DJ-1/PfpI family protein [Sunxiuqinia elliptica]
MKKKIYVFLFDGFSDWEIAYFTPEINRSERFELIYFSVDGKPVSSMGGLSIQPSTSLHTIDPAAVDLLVLPGGTAWEKRAITELDSLTRSVHQAGKPIAAICAATTYLGQLGLLDDLRHTSNDLNYLKEIAPQYRGDAHYQKALAVTDKQVITANGIATIEFAREIFKTIELHTDDNIEKWFQLFKNGVWAQ